MIYLLSASMLFLIIFVANASISYKHYLPESFTLELFMKITPQPLDALCKNESQQTRQMLAN